MEKSTDRETFLGQAHIINEYGSKMVRILNCNTGQEDCVQSSIPCIGEVGFIPQETLQWHYRKSKNGEL